MKVLEEIESVRESILRKLVYPIHSDYNDLDVRYVMDAGNVGRLLFQGGMKTYLVVGFDFQSLYCSLTASGLAVTEYRKIAVRYDKHPDFGDVAIWPLLFYHKDHHKMEDAITQIGLFYNNALRLWQQEDDGDEDPQACPGCGKVPGDGLTDTCNHEYGCGWWRKGGAYR